MVLVTDVSTLHKPPTEAASITTIVPMLVSFNQTSTAETMLESPLSHPLPDATFTANGKMSTASLNESTTTKTIKIPFQSSETTSYSSTAVTAISEGTMPGTSTQFSQSPSIFPFDAPSSSDSASLSTTTMTISSLTGKMTPETTQYIIQSSGINSLETQSSSPSVTLATTTSSITDQMTPEGSISESMPETTEYITQRSGINSTEALSSSPSVSFSTTTSSTILQGTKTESIFGTAKYIIQSSGINSSEALSSSQSVPPSFATSSMMPEETTTESMPGTTRYFAMSESFNQNPGIISSEAPRFDPSTSSATTTRITSMITGQIIPDWVTSPESMTGASLNQSLGIIPSEVPSSSPSTSTGQIMSDRTTTELMNGASTHFNQSPSIFSSEVSSSSPLLSTTTQIASIITGQKMPELMTTMVPEPMSGTSAHFNQSPGIISSEVQSSSNSPTTTASTSPGQLRPGGMTSPESITGASFNQSSGIPSDVQSSFASLSTTSTTFAGQMMPDRTTPEPMTGASSHFKQSHGILSSEASSSSPSLSAVTITTPIITGQMMPDLTTEPESTSGASAHFNQSHNIFLSDPPDSSPSLTASMKTGQMMPYLTTVADSMSGASNKNPEIISSYAPLSSTSQITISSTASTQTLSSSTSPSMMTKGISAQSPPIPVSSSTANLVQNELNLNTMTKGTSTTTAPKEENVTDSFSVVSARPSSSSSLVNENTSSIASIVISSTDVPVITVTGSLPSATENISENVPSVMLQMISLGELVNSTSRRTTLTPSLLSRSTNALNLIPKMSTVVTSPENNEKNSDTNIVTISPSAIPANQSVFQETTGQTQNTIPSILLIESIGSSPSTTTMPEAPTSGTMFNGQMSVAPITVLDGAVNYTIPATMRTNDGPSAIISRSDVNSSFGTSLTSSSTTASTLKGSTSGEAVKSTESSIQFSPNETREGSSKDSSISTNTPSTVSFKGTRDKCNKAFLL